MVTPIMLYIFGDWIYLRNVNVEKEINTISLQVLDLISVYACCNKAPQHIKKRKILFEWIWSIVHWNQITPDLLDGIFQGKVCRYLQVVD